MKKLKKVMLLAIFSAATACSWDINSVDNPHNIVDPESIGTPVGVLSIYKTTVNYFSSTYAGGSFGRNPSFVYASALAGDELMTNADGAFALRRKGIGGDMLESSGPQAPWFAIHQVRAHLDQAIGGARQFPDQFPPHYLVHMYAMRGYLSLFIGELYCSGVPFNRGLYGSDLEFSPGLSTEQVFQKAIADFDSALALSTDSMRFVYLATVGKARGLLNLNDFDQASNLVQHIPTTFNYQIRFASTFPNLIDVQGNLTLADRLGSNGLDYRSAGVGGTGRVADPRMLSAYSSVTFTQVPAKYASTSSPVTLADGLEARLIEAEAMLRNENISGWAGKLNELRRQGLNTPMDTLTEDSTVNAIATLREDVMFRERAFWLYVTGRRFGDMRRKVRQYRRSIESVFPVGVHPALTSAQTIFSKNANLAPPPSEVESNPRYSGCFDRNA